MNKRIAIIQGHPDPQGSASAHRRAAQRDAAGCRVIAAGAPQTVRFRFNRSISIACF